METLRSISELSRLPGPLFLAIGVFDGVHLGHQAVISTSAEHAKVANGTPVVVTFDPHPEKYCDRKRRHIYSPPLRTRSR